MTESTCIDDFVNIVESTTTATETAGRSSQTVYERLGQILSYDVRSIDQPAQAWFWTSEWQERERQADADIAEGRTTAFMSGEQLLEHLTDSD